MVGVFMSGPVLPVAKMWPCCFSKLALFPLCVLFHKCCVCLVGFFFYPGLRRSCVCVRRTSRPSQWRWS